MDHHGYYPDVNAYAGATGEIGQQLPLQQQQQQATIYPLPHHQAYQQPIPSLQQQPSQQIQATQLYHQKNAQQMHYRKHDILDSYGANGENLLNYSVNSGESPGGAIAQCGVDYSAVQYAKSGVEQNPTYYYSKVQAGAYDANYGGYQNYSATATPTYNNASSTSSSPIVLSDYPESPKSHVSNTYGGAIKYNGYQVAGGYKNSPAAPVAPTQWTTPVQSAQVPPAKDMRHSYGMVPVRHPFDDSYSRSAVYMRPGSHPYHMTQDYGYAEKYQSNYFTPTNPYKTASNGKYPVMMGSSPRSGRTMIQSTPEAPVPHPYYNMMRPGNGYQQPTSQVYNRPATHHVPQKEMYMENGMYDDPYGAKINYNTPPKYIPQYEDYHHHHHRHSTNQIPQQSAMRSSVIPGSYQASKIVYQGSRNPNEMCYTSGYQGSYPVSQAAPQQPNRVGYYDVPQQSEKSYIDLEEQINSSKILKAGRPQISDYYQASHYQYLGHHGQVEDLTSDPQVPLKKTNVRDFLSSWNEDEEEENKQSHEHNRSAPDMNSVSCSYGSSIYDMSRPKEFDTEGNPRIHVGITIDNNTTNQSINLPDIIIDIEKPKLMPPEDNVVVNSEKLYVLESIDVPLSELNKYKHLSVVNKLPENIVHFANGESEQDGKDFAASVENSLKFIEEIESNHENYFKSDFEMNVEYDEKDAEPVKQAAPPVSQPERKESVIVANGEADKTSLECSKKAKRKKKRRSSSIASVECYPIAPPKKIKTLQKLCITVINSKDFRKSYEKYLTCKRKEAPKQSVVKKQKICRYTKRYCRRVPSLKELCEKYFVPVRQPQSLKEVCEAYICNHRNLFALEEVPRVPRLSDLCEEVLKINNFIINLDDFSEAPDGANICFDLMISTAGQELLPQTISPETLLQPTQTEENFLDMDANYFSDSDTYRLFDICENNHIQSEEIIPVDVARDRKEKLFEYLRSKYIQRPHHERLFFVKKTTRKYFFYQRYSRFLLRMYRREKSSEGQKLPAKKKRLKIEKKREGKQIPRNHENSLNNNYSPKKSGSEGEGRDKRVQKRHSRVERSSQVEQKKRRVSESHRVAKDLKRQHASASATKRKASVESRKGQRKLNFDEMLLNIDSYYTKTIGRVKSCSRDSDDSSSSSERSSSSKSSSSSSSSSSSTSSRSSSSSSSSSTSSSSGSGTRSPFVKLERSVLIDKMGKMYT